MGKPEYLVAFDFDGTLADTFSKSPKGVGVNEACAQAIAELFGPEGMRAFTRIGGLGNRAPVELIEAIFAQGDRAKMIAQARTYARSTFVEPGKFVPQGKGVPLASLIGDGEPTIPALAEAFVQAKLVQLMPLISAEWPKLMPGAKEAIEALRLLGKDGLEVQFAVLSSGHELFIRKCFEVWNVPQPDILITDDDLRAVPYLSSETKVKPSVHLLARLHQAWRRKRGLQPDQFDLEAERTLRNRGMFYSGDDELRDGALAMRNNVFFGWYNPEAKEQQNGGEKLIDFRDWHEFTEFLTSPELAERLKEGRSMGELWQETRRPLPEQKFV